MYTLEQQGELLKGNKYYKYFGIQEQLDWKGLPREQLFEIYEEKNRELAPYMVKYENPYFSVPHLEPRMFGKFKPGNIISVQEKIDGSNAHFIVHEDGTFECYSNGYVLNEHNHLKGFYFYVRDIVEQVGDVPEVYIYGNG